MKMKRDLILQYILILPLAYVLIFSLYILNKPYALKIKDVTVNTNHLLNQKMLREGDYKYLIAMEQKNLSPDRNALREFEEYFQLVVDSFGKQADSYGMLGYCQYHLGKDDQAIKSYGSAIQANPAFIGYYYNLAVIYYNKGDYHQASMYAKQALEVSLSAEVQGIMSSNRIYRLILGTMPGDPLQNISHYVTDERQRALDLFRKATEELSNPLSPHKKAALELI